MMPNLTSGLRALPAEDDREAPSSVLNACQPLVRWHRLLGFIFLTAAGIVPWLFHEFSLSESILAAITRTPPPWVPQWTEWFGLGCGGLALLNAIAFFRCSGSLDRFTQTRKVVDLHHALCRLRLVWLTLGLSAFLTGGTLTAARWLQEKAKPAAS